MPGHVVCGSGHLYLEEEAHPPEKPAAKAASKKAAGKKASGKAAGKKKRSGKGGTPKKLDGIVLQGLEKDVEIHVYEGADHAFANPSGRNYQEATAKGSRPNASGIHSAP